MKHTLILLTDGYKLVITAHVPLKKSWNMQQGYRVGVYYIKEVRSKLELGETVDIVKLRQGIDRKAQREYKTSKRITYDLEGL